MKVALSYIFVLFTYTKSVEDGEVSARLFKCGKLLVIETEYRYVRLIHVTLTHFTAVSKLLQSDERLYI